uniref:Putative Toluene tolerance family protein n=1 Tax=Magnetococcus massalia (strain MO-1) TaxID=451514 RepID=A0A1S7LJ36_MAGMO|nr:putative Toluene tolerance family protein [Candidatus Magnetococcus massalia]
MIRLFLASRRSLIYSLLLSFALLSVGGTSAHATPLPGGESADIQKAIVRAVSILQDPELAKPENLAERRQQLRQLIYSQFDFLRMSRGAVGRKWRHFNEQQRVRFVELFRQILEVTYMDRIETYQGSGVRFAPEQRRGSRIIQLDSTVDVNGQPISLSYRCLNAGFGWKVYDVYIEGISLVSNYRSQFSYLLRGNDIEGLLTKLQAKVDSNLSKAAEQP